jgi:hypothetical protein
MDVEDRSQDHDDPSLALIQELMRSAEFAEPLDDDAALDS